MRRSGAMSKISVSDNFRFVTVEREDGEQGDMIGQPKFVRVRAQAVVSVAVITGWGDKPATKVTLSNGASFCYVGTPGDFPLV